MVLDILNLQGYGAARWREVSCTQMEMWHWSFWEGWELQMFYHCQYQGDGGNLLDSLAEGCWGVRKRWLVGSDLMYNHKEKAT